VGFDDASRLKIVRRGITRGDFKIRMKPGAIGGRAACIPSQFLKETVAFVGQIDPPEFERVLLEGQKPGATAAMKSCDQPRSAKSRSQATPDADLLMRYCLNISYQLNLFRTLHPIFAVTEVRSLPRVVHRVVHTQPINCACKQCARSRRMMMSVILC